MTARQSRRSAKREHVEIDEGIKKLLSEGIEKAGTARRLAEIMGYSNPTNIIQQFMSAPRYKKFILKSRLERLEKFLQAH